MAGQQQGQTDNSMSALWIIAAIFIFGGIVFWVFRLEIISFILKLRVLEMDLISLFTDDIAPYQQEVANTPAAGATYGLVWEISTKVGNFFKIPVAIILGILAIIMYLANAKLRYRSTFTMQRLIDAEKQNWAQITPVVKLDLVNQNMEKGKWSMAMTPMQFCKKFKLLAEEQEGGVFNPRVKRTATLMRDKTHSIFAMQLGRPWKGYRALRPHAKALFAIFAARANGDRDVAAKLISQIAVSTETGRLNFEGVEELLRKHADSNVVQRVTQNHAYELTVFASMLNLARCDGVLATSDFLWLKPVDRSLWFMLNNVGRQTAFTEVAGPFAHWKVERELGRKICVPMVDEAVNALEAALEEIIYVPDEQTNTVQTRGSVS